MRAVARRMLGLSRHQEWTATQPTIPFTNAMVIFTPGHYCTFGVHINGLHSYHVLLGARGGPPLCVRQLLSIIEEITQVSCLDKTPSNEPRQSAHLINGCAAYGCVIAEYIMTPAFIHMCSSVSTTQVSFSAMAVNAIHARAAVLINEFRSIDLREQRGVHNPSLSIVGRTRTRSRTRMQRELRQD